MAPIKSGPHKRRILAFIVARDGTKCGICGKKVDMRLPGGHLKGPSIDHIIPRGDGGTNARANLRLAHMICNSIRQNLGGYEQLAVI